MSNRQNDDEPIQKIARSETRSIKLWRTVVVGLLLITGAVLSTFTYRLLHNEEEKEFRSALSQIQASISEVTRARVRTLFESLRYLGEALVTHAGENDQEAPFLAMERFEVLARHTRHLTGVENIAYTAIIRPHQVEKWEQFAWENQGWINASRELLNSTNYAPSDIFPTIYELDQTFSPVAPRPGFDFLTPVWMLSPPPHNASAMNINMMTFESTGPALDAINRTRDIVMVKVGRVDLWTGQVWSKEEHEQFHAPHAISVGNISASERPHVLVHSPVFREVGNLNSELVGFFTTTVAFDVYLDQLIPDSVRGIIAVLWNSCGQDYSYKLRGDTTIYLGPGDLHESSYDPFVFEIPFDSYLNPELSKSTPGHCIYSVKIYPTPKFLEGRESMSPYIFAFLVASTFATMAVAFLVYDMFVRRRNTKVVSVAVQSNAVVSSMFPSSVRDRVLNDALTLQMPKSKLKAFLRSDQPEVSPPSYDSDLIVCQQGTTPIAELFPETTIMFADISGFTAWSSTREPSQVFSLLETLYRAFDTIAARMGVFKVETVGDCYVAVAGLPDRNPNHALTMSRFAQDCLAKVDVLMKQLELVLGPGTGELTMKFGLHSGPVTAGVLRGERSRFQLFGDTVNTASYMESQGLPGKIQISQQTRDILVKAGKAAWVSKREELVYAKGKGKLSAFWLEPSTRDTKSVMTVDSTCSNQAVWDPPVVPLVTAHDPTTIYSQIGSQSRIALTGTELRLVEWNTEILQKLLEGVLSCRPNNQTSGDASSVYEEKIPTAKCVLQEVTAMSQPAYMDYETGREANLSEEVHSQLRNYVTSIARLYRHNAFHNFEHASHVLLSVVKLISRIKTPEERSINTIDDDSHYSLEETDYGISEDAMVHFAVAMAALVHDVDHMGIPNSQLVKEKSKLSTMYGEVSVAEQHSFNVAWILLHQTEFRGLRQAIFPNDNEKSRFRQIFVNSVMATDILDNDLRRKRSLRWLSAFGEEGRNETTSSRKRATAVLDCLMQASDISHTMQHWHVYRKWNEKLFREVYWSYADGRTSRDPSEYWFRAEVGFFDHIVIPLANRLVESNVFGVSGEEYLKYALGNRDEWIERGRSIVEEMTASILERGVV